MYLLAYVAYVLYSKLQLLAAMFYVKKDLLKYNIFLEFYPVLILPEYSIISIYP